PFGPEMADRSYEIRLQIAFAQQFEKGHLRIEVGSNLRALDLLAAFEYHTPSAPATNQYAGNRRTGADLDPFGAAGSGDRFGNHPHASADKPPQAAMPSDSPHTVVQ